MARKIDSKKLPKIAINSVDDTDAAASVPVKTAKLATATSTKAKETIYIDVDDEITSIIEKVSGARGDIIALVLPKRAAVLQSVVNMKLLKRAGDQAGKNLVVVSSESTLKPLVGLVGLHMADSVTGKPYIPAAPDVPSDEPDSIEEQSENLAQNSGLASDYSPETQAMTPVGELANISEADTPEEIELDNTAAAASAATAEDAKPVKKDKKLAVPNFDMFRNRMLLGVLGLVLLVVFWYLAVFVLPRATIAITSETSTINSTLDTTLSTTQKALDEKAKILPAVAQKVSKTSTQQAIATGQQNNGEKAVGKITITNCTDNDISVATGTSFTRDGKTFVSTEAASVPGSNFKSNGACKEDGKDTVNVVALKGGASSNLSAGSYTFSLASSTVTAYGSSMSGGTDMIVKVLTQSDIDAAKAKVTTVNQDAIKSELESSLKARGLMVVPTTFVAGEQQVTSTANAGDKVDSATVTIVTPFSMLGVNKTDVKQLVVINVEKQIDKDKQKILSDGVDKTSFAQSQPATDASANVSMKVRSVAGPELNPTAIKETAKGQKAKTIENSIRETPGVSEVKVNYSPFWVTSAPKDPQKITVVINGES